MRWLFRIPKMFFVGLIRNPQIATTLGMFCLLCLVWFGGPLVGISRIEDRLILLVVILFLWVVFLMMGRIREGNAGRSLEESLKKQGEEQLLSTRPDRKEEIKVLQGELEKAIYALKHSKLGKGRRGTAALYALPWYMFIGPSASGKSTALQHSGLTFPYLGSSGKGIQGVGGTRNCDWWFTSEAVLLDTAGRYVTEDEDREEWFGFLDLLKKSRKKKPINGIIAAISIADLFEADDEEVERHAKNMRGRIDELTERLGITFPIYLVFTKCDLLQGFVAFFEDLNKREREQIWGATFSIKDLVATQSHRAFDVEFQRIVEGLNGRRMERLASVRGARKIGQVYSFPLQFDSGREKLSRFVEILFKSNPYRENPIFRGFYFTSGTQEGTPIDHILKAVSQSSGLPEVQEEGADIHTVPKSYFIKDLFTEVIFQDQFLAGPSSAMARQTGYMRVAVFVLAALFMVVSISGLAFSFLGNKQLIRSIRSVSLDVAKMNIQDRRQFEKNIPLLDALRQRLIQLQSHEVDGAPLRLRLGLYQGSELTPSLRELYFNRFDGVLLSPVKQTVERSLNQFAAGHQRGEVSLESDYYYSLLKVYLMLADPSRLDPTFLRQWFLEIIKGKRFNLGALVPLSGDLQALAMEQVDFYLLQIASGSGPLFRLNQSLIKGVRSRLLDLSLGERLYADIKNNGMERFKPYTLNRAMEGAPQNFLLSDFQIPGFFTRAGWEAFPDIMENVLSGSGEVSWVLGLTTMNQDKMGTDIKNRYHNEYSGYWQRYMESVQVLPGKTLFDIHDKTDGLMQINSPLKQFLVGIDRNTYLIKENEGPILSKSEGILGKTAKMIGLKNDDKNAGLLSVSASSNPVSIKFESLHKFVTKASEQETPPLIEQYGHEIGKIDAIVRGVIQKEETGLDARTVAKGIIVSGENDLVQGARNTEKLLQTLDPPLRLVLAPLFLEPFRMTAEGFMHAAIKELNHSWREEIHRTCRQNLAGRYPFKNGGEDAAMDDISDFLQPENGLLWQFYNREIKPFVEKKGDRFIPKKRMGVRIPFSERFLENLQRLRLLSESFFGQGSQNPTFSFGLYPYPSKGVSESIFKMDGNTLRYRNEPQEWYEFTWPGNTGSPGASLEIRSDGIRQERHFSGRWGFFKLLDKGAVKQVSTNKYRLVWRIKKPDGTLVEIKYDLRASSYKNPLIEGLFSGFRCTETVGLNEPEDL